MAEETPPITLDQILRDYEEERRKRKAVDLQWVTVGQVEKNKYKF